MILEISKIWSKSGPVDLLTITKMQRKIRETYGIILDKYYLCQSGTQAISIFFEKCMSYVQCFLLLFRVLLNFEYIF